jgi:hypothetical protein
MRPVLLAALALAACGQPPAPSVANEGAAASVGGPSAPAPAPSATPEPALTTLPPAYRGRWGLVPADCEPGRDDAKGLVEITDRTLKFYESRATLTSVRSERGALRVALAFSGEGQTWTTDESLRLSDETLVRTPIEPASDVLRYMRCSSTSPA